ncbi:uncharacterized protein zgc:193711 [Engraulis encrasicolus]|uniref:uncharacterized protein zgc:193711 n=1 Tax=Engraulis encrasicolus TaxID=184585 RepID=UPI002FD416B3
MGNSFTTTVEKWGIDTKKLKMRTKKRKERPPPPQQTAEAHLYDTVPEEPLYAKVNKKRRPEEDNNIHYAEIQVVQSSQMASRERQRPPPVGSTEYATIDFNGAGAHPSSQPPPQHTMAPPLSTQPADILIPPGALQKPKAQSHSKRTRTSERAIIV